MNFQDWGQMAGGVTLGARPFIDHYLKNIDEEKQSKQMTDTLTAMTAQNPMYNEADIATMGQDINWIKAQEASGIPSNELQQQMVKADTEAQQAMRDAKSSYIDQLAGMSPNDRLAEFTKGALAHGIKIDKTSMGIFDMLSKGVDAGKAQLDADQVQAQKDSSRKVSGLFVDRFMKANPKYAPIIDGMLQQGVQAEDMASLLPTISSLVKQDESISARQDMFNQSQETKKDMFNQSQDTKRELAQIVHGGNGAMSQYQAESLDIKRQDKIDKKTAEEEKKQEKKQAEIDKRYSGAEKVLQNKAGWDKLDDSKQEEAKQYYAKYGVAPTVSTDESVFGDKHTWKTKTAPSGAKSSPTKTDSRGDIIKQIKASHPNATQGQIDAFLKSKGY